MTSNNTGAVSEGNLVPKNALNTLFQTKRCTFKPIDSPVCMCESAGTHLFVPTQHNTGFMFHAATLTK